MVNKSTSTSQIERLIETNIQLQDKMTDVALEIKELITIFKSASEHIKTGKYEDPLLKRLNELAEQNKNLSQALQKLEQFVKDKEAATTNPLEPRSY